eukprot:IDg22139t1
MRSCPLTVAPAALRSLALRNGTAPRPPPVRSSVQHAGAPPRVLCEMQSIPASRRPRGLWHDGWIRPTIWHLRLHVDRPPL